MGGGGPPGVGRSLQRRGLHDEGSRLVQSLMTGKADMDFETARRLFTLICVLHIK